VKPNHDEHARTTAILVGMGIGGILCGLAVRDADPGVIALAVVGGVGIGGGIPAGVFSNLNAPPHPQFGVRIPLSYRPHRAFR
jgi:hypothetical protein